jgi:hypothetical protein
MGATVTIAPAAARAVSGVGTAVAGNGPASTMRVQLNVTAASGTTPTLDVVLEDSVDGSNFNAITGGTFTQFTATGRQAIDITAPFTDNIRARWTVGGTTPSFTFSVVAYQE